MERIAGHNSAHAAAGALDARDSAAGACVMAAAEKPALQVSVAELQAGTASAQNHDSSAVSAGEVHGSWIRADVTDSEAAQMLYGADSGVQPLLDRHAYRTVKRIIDIVASGAAIVVLLVPSVVLSAAICIASPGAGPLYSQLRVGRVRRDGTFYLFRMWKFRSMVPHADKLLDELKDLNEADGPMFKIKDDPRVIPGIGKFIRKHSMASVIIGTPGDGESTKSLSRSANSSLDLQLCERRPGLCCFARTQYKRFQFLSVVVFRDARGVFNRTFTRISSLVPSAPLRGYAEGCSSFLSISKAVRCNDGGECCRRVA